MQQYRSWDDLLAIWRFADANGWDSCWGFDHFFSLDEGDEAGPCLEGWSLLAGLARETQRLKLGLLVTGNTHRHPAVLAKQAVTVDHLADGRLILGMGASWQEREHAAYGIPFPPAGERVERFGEAMEIIHLLESQERTTFQGRYYQLDDAPFEPKPVAGHIPVLIGSVRPRMLRHVARYADIWDGQGTPEELLAIGLQLNERCREIGRDPAEVRWAHYTTQPVLRSAEAFREHVAAYSAVGVRSFLFYFDARETELDLQTISAAVIPALRDEFAATGGIEGVRR
jgi:alkanesulfonate monooxygenase SsuD/methylene tetrahydromethanopterin reductase-like flavin-dependent oxidoreductase (luciferase family)